MEDHPETNLERLRASERQYRRLFETAKDGILILHFDTGEIMDVNPFLTDLLGYSREDFLGRELWEVGPFKDIQASREAFTVLKQKGYIRYDDLPLQTREGRLVSVEFVSNAYQVNGGKVIQCNIRDITLRKQISLALQQAKEEAEHANKAKDRLIGMVSHELRTPLNPMKLLVHAWKTDKDFPQRLLSDLEILRRNLEIESQLIDDLLDVTAIQRGKFKVSLQLNDVHEILRYAVETLQPEIEESQSQVTLSLNARHSAVHTDFTRLAQVFWNLIKNAVKFTPAGGFIAVSTENEGGNIQIIIADTGIGIDEQKIMGIYEAFDQGSHGETHAYGGMGLGLTIAKSIVELLGGSIAVRSGGTGKGTVFAVTLPTSQT